MLTQVEIKGFKCLHDVRVDLKPFNVLIGPNDSGKSSFLQALAEPSRFSRGQPQIGASSRGDTLVHLWTKQTDLALGYGPNGWSVQVGGQKLDPNSLMHDRAQHLSDRIKEFLRVSEPVMLDPTRIAALSPRGSGTLAELIASRGQGTGAHIARVALGDRERYDAIQQAMRDLTKGRVREVIVGEDLGNSGYPISFRLCDGAVVPAREMSQGLLLYLAFLALIHRDDAPGVLLIEEPENGLHPLRLYEVVSLLRSLTDRGVQIVMTTHSPDLLNACKPDEVLVFLRPEPESGTQIHRLPADFERRAMGDTIGQVWASSGEEGLLDLLPRIDPTIQTDAP